MPSRALNPTAPVGVPAQAEAESGSAQPARLRRERLRQTRGLIWLALAVLLFLLWRARPLLLFHAGWWRL